MDLGAIQDPTLAILEATHQQVVEVEEHAVTAIEAMESVPSPTNAALPTDIVAPPPNTVNVPAELAIGVMAFVKIPMNVVLTLDIVVPPSNIVVQVV